MKPSPSHRIRKQRWLVSTGSAAEAFAIRQHLHDHWQDLLLPAFDQAFNEAVNGEQVIHIPKIELRLKVTSKEQLAEMLPSLIYQHLREHLQSALQKQPRSNEPGILTTTTQPNQFDILLHYLHTGLIPWHIANTSPATITSELKATCHQRWVPLLDYLQNQRKATASFYFRLFQLLSEDKLITLVKTLFNNIPQTWWAIGEQFVTLLLREEPRFFNRHTQHQLVIMILMESMRNRESANAPDFAFLVESALSQEEKSRLKDFILSLPAAVAILFQPKLTETVLVDNAILLPTLPHAESDSSVGCATYYPLINASSDSDTFYDVLLDESVWVNNVALLPTLHQTAVFNPPTKERFPLTVNHAGLVLLHPFISPFVENRGAKEIGKTQLASLPRAAALLHFLATGQEEIYEYELGLIKILLGLSPDIPLLVAEGLIESSDQAEIETLLQSVIHHWSILKNTSVHGLRTSFLQRQALLSEAENGWKLQVECQAFDMLLNYLPWSISVVKLPWMKQAIYSEWPTP